MDLDNVVQHSYRVPPIKRMLKSFRMAMLLRFRYRFVSVGRDFYMGRHTHVRPGCVTVGDHCFIGNYCHIASEVHIGNWVMVASHVSMVGGDHQFRELGVPSIWASRGVNRPIVIADDVWVGHGAIILHGVTIGEGAIVAAGALVTRDVPAYTIVGSHPAEVIGQRFSEAKARKHMATLNELRRSRGLQCVYSDEN